MGKMQWTGRPEGTVSEGENNVTLAHIIVSQLGAKLVEELGLGWRTVGQVGAALREAEQSDSVAEGRGEEPSAGTEALLLDEALPGVALLDVVGQSWNVLPDLRIFGNSLHLSPERRNYDRAKSRREADL